MLKIGCHLSSAGGYMAMLGDAVSIKATTMEKLGPIGAREGIAAQAVALIESIA